MSDSQAWQLQRNSFGQLVFSHNQQNHVGVMPVRAFALSAPEECIALVDTAGHEVLWLDKLSDAPAVAQQLLREELAQRDFVPLIQEIQRVDSFATPSTWQVITDRGATELVLKAEEDIRRLPNQALLIADGQGVQYLIRDWHTLNSHSKKILKRFL